MKSKKTSLLLIISFFCLVFSGWFYFASPTDDKEKKVEVFIMSETNNWQQERLKAGIDQAAKELDTKILYKEVSQKEYLRQQKKSKTKKTDFVGTVMYGGKIDRKNLNENSETINLELKNFQSESTINKTVISTDYQRGITLGSYLMKHDTSVNHLIYWQASKEGYSKERLSGLKKNKKWSEEQIECVSGEISKVMHLIHYSTRASGVCLAFDTPQQWNEYVEFSKLNGEDNRVNTYMFEFSDKILAAIDEGKLSGAIFQDDYSRGYQSIYQLMGTKQEKQRQLPKNRMINKKNLFSKGNEPLIFPYDE